MRGLLKFTSLKIYILYKQHLLCKVDPYVVLTAMYELQARDDLVLRAFNFCIIDEVDSILIDEARTPLIISGGAQNYLNLG